MPFKNRKALSILPPSIYVHLVWNMCGGRGSGHYTFASSKLLCLILKYASKELGPLENYCPSHRETPRIGKYKPTYT